jgi:hypothetical protein
VDIGGPAWIVNASKSTREEEAEINGKTWMLAVPGFDLFLVSPKKPLYGKRSQKTSFKILACLFRDSEGRLIDKSLALEIANKPSE